MSTLTVRLNDEQHNLIKESAEFHGETLADFIRETLMSRIEDELDYAQGIAVLNENNATVSRDEVLKQIMGE